VVRINGEYVQMVILIQSQQSNLEEMLVILMEELEDMFQETIDYNLEILVSIILIKDLLLVLEIMVVSTQTDSMI
jgi:hypothetical protein